MLSPTEILLAALTVTWATVKIIITPIVMFFRNIILLDCVVLSFLAFLSLELILHINVLLSLILAIILCGVLYAIHLTKFGFWLLALPMSLCWGLFFMISIYDYTKNEFLSLIALIVAFVLVLLLHLKVRDAKNAQKLIANQQAPENMP